MLHGLVGDKHESRQSENLQGFLISEFPQICVSFVANGGQARHCCRGDRDWKVSLLVARVSEDDASTLSSSAPQSHENVLQVVVAEGCTRIHHPTFHQLLSSELSSIYYAYYIYIYKYIGYIYTMNHGE